jgi:hypothetical protein
VGYTFWRDSLHQLLQIVEKALSRWCLLQLPLGNDALRQLVRSQNWSGDADTVTGETLDNRVDRKAYALIWGEWLGREHELFRRCAELVSPLSWAEALALSGPEARVFARLTQEAYQQLVSQEVPSALNVGPFQLVQIKNGVTRINTYNTYDPLDVPQAVMELLRYFDGHPTDDVLAAIARERGIRLDPALVQKMVDFKLLVAQENGA